MLTIITPTYNRGYILHKAYESLLSQTDKRFIWMIIDDGSTDNTEELVSEWKKENKISITYYKKKNGGKASALNVAIEKISTGYAVCLDSDDMFYPDTVSKALVSLESVKHDNNCCGILALRNNPDGTVMGERNIPKEYTNITAVDIFLKLSLRTELICFYKTEILNQFRFPEFEKEKFVSPAWMQYMVTQEHYFKTSWEKLCCCEYVSDGLTKNKRRVIVNNPKGYLCVKKLSFNYSTNLKQIIKNGIMYDCGCIIAKNTEWLKDAPRKIFALLLMPLGYIAYIIKFQKMSKK